MTILHRSNRQSWLAWILFALVCVSSIANLTIGARFLLASHNLFTIIDGLVWIVFPIIFSFVAALIISRQPRNRIAWLMMAPTILFIPAELIDHYLSQFTSAPPATAANLVMTIFQGLSWLLLIFPLFFIMLLFPTGRPPSPRWRWVLGFALGMCVLFILFVTFEKDIHYVNGNWSIPNPIGWIPSDVFDTLLTIPWTVSLIGVTIASVISVFVRYRRAQAVERLQIKWLLYAGAIFMVSYTLAGSQSDAQGFFHDITNLFFGLSIFLIPLAIAIAILRYRLWDINVIIRKTLIYSALTAFLALIFFGSVILLQRLFTALTGTQDSPLVVVFSTLMIAALFNPLRGRIQNFIDRRFFRAKYNSELILDQFASTIRNEVEMQRLTEHLLSVVEETVQPESIGLWLKTGSNQ